MSALPLTVVSGYLGAGKTTLLNGLLARPLGQAITVLVNDFGEIAIDASLIENRNGDTIALTNGCVCCTLGGDLYDAIDRILCAPVRPDRLIIETSGVADPEKIRQIAVAEPDLRADRTVTLVDCVNAAQQLDDPLLADSLERQIRAADLLILSKTDLANGETEARILERLARLAPGVRLLATGAPSLTSEILLAPRGEVAAPQQATPALPHHHGAEYATWHYRGDARPDAGALRAASARQVSGCLRLKGRITDRQGRGYLVERAGNLWSATPIAPPEYCELVAIGLAGTFDAGPLDRLLGSGPCPP